MSPEQEKHLDHIMPMRPISRQSRSSKKSLDCNVFNIERPSTSGSGIAANNQPFTLTLNKTFYANATQGIQEEKKQDIEKIEPEIQENQQI